jgi:hypothetical protein
VKSQSTCLYIAPSRYRRASIPTQPSHTLELDRSPSSSRHLLSTNAESAIPFPLLHLALLKLELILDVNGCRSAIEALRPQRSVSQPLRWVGKHRISPKHVKPNHQTGTKPPPTRLHVWAFSIVRTIYEGWIPGDVCL